jgi:hypothetical protein
MYTYFDGRQVHFVCMQASRLDRHRLQRRVAFPSSVFCRRSQRQWATAEGKAPSISAQPCSRHRVIQTDSAPQLRLQNPLSGRAVEKNLISICFPDCGKLYRSRTVKAEINSTGFLTPPKDAFRHPKRIVLQLVMVT